MKRFWIPFAFLVLGSSLAACSSTEPIERAPLQFEGEVTTAFGGWVVEATDGTTYEPINLADEFKEEGLLVRVGAEIAEGYGSRIMVGPVVRILRIERQD